MKHYYLTLYLSTASNKIVLLCPICTDVCCLYCTCVKLYSLKFANTVFLVHYIHSSPLCILCLVFILCLYLLIVYYNGVSNSSKLCQQKSPLALVM